MAGIRIERSSGALLLLLSVMLVGCSAEEERVEPRVGTRPVKVFSVGNVDDGAVRTFPARIEAAQRAELGFRVSGTVAEILVVESEPVSQGQVLARLDPRDLQLVLDDRQATFDNAERNFARGKELIVTGNISRTDYDNMEAQYRSAEAALDTARQNVAYTELVAPFAGRVAKRSVEKFEEVTAKQTVFTLQQVDSLDVVIDIPESFLRQIRVSSNELGIQEERGRPQRAWVTFEDVPDERFPLTLKEASTTADPQTQTFEVTYSMKSPETFVVLPGMSAQVSAEMAEYFMSEEVFMVPANAVVADASLDPHVWLLDPESMTVSKRVVTVGSMSGTQIEVRSGLYPGDEIVAVGAAYLADGMRVTRMLQTEQAAPRSEDPRSS